MPRRKSAPSLENLCLQHVYRNLNTLKDRARYLPLHLINDLYDEDDHPFRIPAKMSPPPVPLPADLFLHSETKIIRSLDRFDQPVNEIVKKISQICNNLQSIFLLELEEEHIDCIRTITASNRHLLKIDLSGSKCTNRDLYVIGKHCPELQHLDLYNCEHVTDEGMSFLPKKITSLSLPLDLQITVRGHLIVLDYLPHLKTANHTIDWDEVIKTLADRVDGRTYEIEEMEIYLNEPTSCNIPRTVSTLFPKLRKVEFDVFFTPVKKVSIFLESINCDLLTYLYLYTSADFIQIAASLCPMLEDLTIKVHSGNQMCDDRWLAKPNNTPFKCLRHLSVRDKNSNLSFDDWKLLLTNSWLLESLCLKYVDQLSDQLIYDVLAMNPLQCLEGLTFNQCEQLSVNSLFVLLNSLHSLHCLRVSSCMQILAEDKISVAKLVKEMNWDIHLNWK